ncbi:MAG: transposase [Gammaproteobacteria bacterium]|nr:transposase [Gammaproteobacteria bacterium]
MYLRDPLTDWAKAALAPGSLVLADGLACFTGVIAAGCSHQALIIGLRKPNEVPEFGWVNTILGNLKTSFSGAYHSFSV